MNCSGRSAVLRDGIVRSPGPVGVLATFACFAFAWPSLPLAQQDELPDAAQVLDRYVEVTGGRAAYDRLSTRVEEITIEPVGSGLTFSMTAFYARPNEAVFLIDAGPLGKIEQGTDGRIAWESSSRTGPAIKEGAERDSIVRMGTFDRFSRWRELFRDARCLGVVAVDGEPCHEVTLTPRSGDAETHYYELDSGLLVKTVEVAPDGSPSEMYFDDYREVDGVLVSHAMRRVAAGQVTKFTVVSRTHDVEIPDDRFDFPDEIQALLTGGAPDPDELHLQSFDRVWSIVDRQFWDPDFGGVDWRAVREELRPRAEEASTITEVRSILDDMISRLGLSHFAIVPGQTPAGDAPPRPAGGAGGETGIDARVIGGKALVTSIAEGSAAERVGVEPGWEVVRVGDYDVVASLEALDRALPETPAKRVKMTAGMVVRVRSGAGDSVAITFRDGEGEELRLAVPLEAPRGRLAQVGNFGQARVRIEVDVIDDDIGYVAVSKFLDPAFVMEKFAEAMASFMDAEGIVLDLRGNGGGKDAMALEMMGWLAPNEWVAGRIRTRGGDIEMVVRPRPRTYDGPVAVLTDGLTGSSAEFVAAALQEIGRAAVIGTRTKGEALPAEYTKLPNGDVFLYAVADFVTGDGARLEGVGVTPDVEVALTRESLLEGRDLVLEAAIDWVRSQ